MTNIRCEARRQGDEMYCKRCAFTWDKNDPEPPTCLPAPADKPTVRMIEIFPESIACTATGDNMKCPHRTTVGCVFNGWCALQEGAAGLVS